MPRQRVISLLAGVLLAAMIVAAAAAQWDPRAWADESTVELRTEAAQEGEHWFPVWLVVIDGQLYVRLGARAASRIERNLTRPFVGVRIAGQQFDEVRAVPSPEYTERVAQAMASKYWSDWFVHWLSHPMTLRLVPEPEKPKR